MLHASGKLWLFIIAALAPLQASAQPLVPASQASVELERATRATHAVLVAYSGVLGDLVGAYHVALAQGQLSQATSWAPIDAKLQGRLSGLTQRLPPSQSSPLPPLPQVYHSRAHAALTALGRASTLADLLAPSQALIAALAHLQDAERDLVVAWAEAQAPNQSDIDPVWAGPIDEAMVQLQRLVALLGETPKPQALDAQVELFDGGAGPLVASITWTPPPSPQATAKQLCICAIDATGVVSRCSARVQAELGRWQERLPQDAWASPPTYRISTSSPFGVHSRPREHVPRLAGGTTARPTGVTATSLAPAADSPEFYRMVDAVQISWRLSLSDGPEAGWDETLQLHPPHRLRGYGVYRVPPTDVARLSQLQQPEALLAALEPFCVGEARPQETQFIDRPPLDALAAGLHYVVAALPARGPMGAAVDGGLSQPRGPSAVQLQLGPAWQLAAHGATLAHQPLGWERQRITTLQEDVAQLQAAKAGHGRLPRVVQRALWEGFWRSVPASDRQQWWNLGQALYASQEAQELLRAGRARLSQAGQGAAQLAMYIEAHPDVAAAVQQHWALLDEAGKRRATNVVSKYLVAALQGTDFLPSESEPTQTAEITRWSPVGRQQAALQVAAWWHSRDSAQVAAVAAWWRDLTHDERTLRLTAWLGARTPEAQQALVWPPWAALTPAEQQVWLLQPPEAIPEVLWPRFLAHIEHQALPLQERIAAVRDDVGAWKSFLMQSRYLCRPADKLFNFEFAVALTFVGLGLLSGYLLGCARVRSSDVQPG